MERRDFIKLSAGIIGLAPFINSCTTPKAVTGKIIGASANIGHLMRDGKLKGKPVSVTERNVVIVGGGVSGLSAARQLSLNGIEGITILDLEEKTGGNAACGGNAISKYPWGAHYIPIPNIDLAEYLSFLEKCNVITGWDANKIPIYNEYYLCQDPEERLYINGLWQDGLVPNYGLNGAVKAEFQRFFKLMAIYRNTKGNDGKDVFAIPINNSSNDEKWTSLDAITMKEWMLRNGFKSDYIQHYINYCTRDDFGTKYDEISAWAGIHYFAGRKGKASNAASQDVLTWEQGNGFLVNQLQKDIRAEYLTHSLVIAVKSVENDVHVDYYDVATKSMKRIVAKQCIMATPQFINGRLLNDKERIEKVHQKMEYAPWMVANLTVGELEERSGQTACWDNVLYGSESLGYVDATHQQLQQLKDKRNLTYYLPLTQYNAKEARSKALKTTYGEWVKIIVGELKIVHPNIATALEHVDIMLWGHAMAQPLPGMIFGGIRKELSESIQDHIHFAHTDLAGVSIFEEAFYQGLNAANKVLKQLS